MADVRRTEDEDVNLEGPCAACGKWERLLQVLEREPFTACMLEKRMWILDAPGGATTLQVGEVEKPGHTLMR